MKGGTRQRTALHYASSNGHASIVQLLLSSGAQEFVRDIGGYTALNLCQGEACHLLHSVSSTYTYSSIWVNVIIFLCICVEANVFMHCCAKWRC